MQSSFTPTERCSRPEASSSKCDTAAAASAMLTERLLEGVKTFVVAENWYEKLARVTGKVFVFCSNGQGAVDPAGTTTDCQSYQFVGDAEWRPIPDGVRVPHPFRANGTTASAFVVERIEVEPGFVFPAAESLSKEGS